MRQAVYAALPLGKGVIADPFMGSGSTIAAAEAMGLQAIGAERYLDYFSMAADAIPQLAALGKKKEPVRRLKATPLTAELFNELEILGAVNPV
jgi:site-specific DNA-methyltransferase (adenine-specific)